MRTIKVGKIAQTPVFVDIPEGCTYIRAAHLAGFGAVEGIVATGVGYVVMTDEIPDGVTGIAVSSPKMDGGAFEIRDTASGTVIRVDGDIIDIERGESIEEEEDDDDDYIDDTQMSIEYFNNCKELTPSEMYANAKEVEDTTGNPDARTILVTDGFGEAIPVTTVGMLRYLDVAYLAGFMAVDSIFVPALKATVMMEDLIPDDIDRVVVAVSDIEITF